MTRFKIFLLSAITFSTVASCSKFEIDTPRVTGDGISFRPSTTNTKAQSVTNDALNPFKTMGIYAAATGEQDYSEGTHSANYLQDIKVERADAASAWRTAQNYYWPVGKTTFFGYAPFNASGSKITHTTPGAPIIDFTVDADQSRQIDLLIASTIRDATKTQSAVTIPMKHALTKIGFSAKLSHDPTQAQNINSLRITKIEIFGVFSSGKHAMDAQAEWMDLGKINEDANPFGVSDDAHSLGGLLSTNLSTTYQKLTLEDGYLFMLPQSFDQSNAKIKVYVAAEWAVGNGNVAFDDPIEFDLALTGLNWNQGEAINYNINIDITDHVQTGSTISAEVVHWNDVQVDSEILNRQLNLTRVKVDVIDAAVTRVYFWSNQPKEEVYISSKCYQGTIPSAGGEEKNVEDIFTNLTASNPWQATNLHYDQTTGEGYFELNRANSNSAMDTYLIYVYAGGLRRSVEVNIKNTNYPAPIGIKTSPFVGTFHRHSEYGERIITWNNTGPWVAVIEPENSHRNPDGSGGNADYLDVIFDRYISPAQEAGILHTSSPGNAEDYTVSNSWDKIVTVGGKETRALAGNGKVYLRVGWKKENTRATLATVNRYAKITVRDQIEDMQTSRILGILFIRKGETEDYLMRPEDAIQGNHSSSNRTNAVKFSPYDVTSPYGTALKDKYFEYPITPSGGGVFVDYPTQAGAYYKWGQGRGISIFTEKDPWGFAITVTGKTPLTWKDAIDVCPEGYRVPMYDKENLSVGWMLPNYTSLDNLELLQSLYLKPELETTNLPYTWRKNIPYPDDLTANWVWGYYADGYFDRGKINLNLTSYWVTYSKVSYNGNEGYNGFLMFNPTTLSSVFFPATGHINPGTGLYLGGNYVGVPLATNLSDKPNGFMELYLIRFEENNTTKFLNVVAPAVGEGAAIGKGSGFSYRCVKGEKSDITSDGKYVLYFDNETMSAPATILRNKGESVQLPTLNGFRYWCTTPDGVTGKRYNAGATFTFTDRFTSLYAIW